MLKTSASQTLGELGKLRKEPLLLTAVLAIVLSVFLFVIWPLVKVMSYPQLSDYAEFIAESRWFRIALNSLFITALSTISCTLVAFLYAYVIVRLDVPFKRLFRFVTILPIVSPPFIVALSYILLFGGQGLIMKNILHLNIDIYGWHGLWFVQTITYFPYAYAVIHGVLDSISPNLEYAACNMGASRWQVFKGVLLPLATPGIAGGALIAAVNVLADFGNPIMIGGNFNVLPTEAYMQVVGNFDMPVASMLVTMLLIPAVSIFIINRYWVGRRSYVTITGKESLLPKLKESFWVKWGLFSLCLAVTAIILGIYGVLFYGAFAKTWGYDWSFTINNFKNVWIRGMEVLNSLEYSLAASLLAVLLSAAMAYIVQKKRTGLNRFIDFLAILPGAIPGIFLGLGYAIAFNDGPPAMSGTAAIMIIALTFWNIPACYTANTAALQQISTSIEEASQNLGAGSFRTFRSIILPLLKIPVASGFIVAFLRTVTCLSVVIFIYSADTSVGTISILAMVQNGEWGSAAAFTIVLISIAFAVLGISQMLLRRLGKSLER